MASPPQYSARTQNIASPFPQSTAQKWQWPAHGRSGAPPVTALSVEFVARPQEAHRVESAIPAAIAGSLKDVTGFAGCLVMISDQEARLVTVVTLWAGDECGKRCNQNIRWVQALLAPYLDRCLRVQTMIARLPVMTIVRTETSDDRGCRMTPALTTGDETVCVA